MLTLAMNYWNYWYDAFGRMLHAADICRQENDLAIDTVAEEGKNTVSIFPATLVKSGEEFGVNYLCERLNGSASPDFDQIVLKPDPKAGRGDGVSETKPESQAGIALELGLPTYRFPFSQEPLLGQTMEKNKAFVANCVESLKNTHGKPVTVFANCQAGCMWASAAAGYPGTFDDQDILILSGSPTGGWMEEGFLGMLIRISGEGAAAFCCDCFGGQIPGELLSGNFEELDLDKLGPVKYGKLLAGPYGEAGRMHLQRAGWWLKNYNLAKEELLWAQRNVFISNELARKMKDIRARLVILCSKADTITSVMGALAFLMEYQSDQEIIDAGKVIILAVDDEAGHLDIFASGRVARQYHEKFMTRAGQIRNLKPGLWIMKRSSGGEASFERISLDGVKKEFFPSESEIRNLRRRAESFERISRQQRDFYESTWGPYVRAIGMYNRPFWRLCSLKAPMKDPRAAFSSWNPVMFFLPNLLPFFPESEDEQRKATANPFRAFETQFFNDCAAGIKFVLDSWVSAVRPWVNSCLN